ncbi:MAG: glycoside hydrolase family 32 protein [Solobacterium sp.]|nr:glycoside hydrolase family 32 protein [Solobacterium sp.]
MSQALRNAQHYEWDNESRIRPEERPGFHLSARVGWMNDPNGFSFYNGMYHMFYQYHPYDSHWGPMHWGHAVSRDLLHWQYLPAAMAPDHPYDRDGCFSGSAITLNDGQHLLMYTGVIRYTDGDGNTVDIQTQNIAYGDGESYTKSEHNPVIKEEDLPEGGSIHNFRDPKIWQMPDGSFRCILANEHKGHGGWFLLYRSDDLIHWKFMHTLAENDNRIGLMWECPDFFELDGEHIILASAQDMLPKGFEYHNGNGTFWLSGTYDEASERFTETADHAVDYGIDFYAPQTIRTEDGRRIMIGWMQNWDTCNLHTKSTPWFGMMSLPRELHLKNGILYQTPIRELEALRTNHITYRDILVSNGNLRLEGLHGRMLDMELELRAADPEKMYQRFAVRFAQNEECRTGVSFRPFESTLKIDRKFSGTRRAIINQRRAFVPHDRGTIKLRLIIDRFSVEIFVNDGEKAMSAVITTDLSAEGVSFFCDGSVLMNVSCYTLDPANW